MAQKEIKLLEQQIVRLNDKEFDLEAWKKYTVIILARIFGSGDEKIKQVDQLDFEFSSWTLRDASGDMSYEEGTIKLAKEILTAAIDEIKVFGIPDKTNLKESVDLDEILNIILDELKGSQVKELKVILRSRQNMVEKRRLIKEMFEDLGESDAYETLTSIILQKQMAKLIKG